MRPMTIDHPPLRKEILDLAWPILISGFLGTIIMFTDRLILGQYDANTLASMQVIGPVTWTAFSIFGSFGIGMLAILGRAVGAKDTNRANAILSTSLVVAALAGVLLGILGFVGRDWITTLLLGNTNPSPIVHNMATTYLAWTFACAPFTTIAVILTFGFQASGDSRTPMWSSFIGGLVNLSLSWLLVFGAFGFPEMGITGAAIGTVSASLINCLLLGMHIQNPQRTIRITSPNFILLHPVLKVALPTFAERILLHSGFLVFTGFVGRLGTEAMAAHQACMAIESLGFIASYALGSASGTIVAQKLGANKPSEAEATITYTLRFSLGLMCLIGLIFYWGADTFVGWFCTDPDSFAMGVSCMKIAAIAQPLMAFCDCFGGSLRGAGDTKSPMIAAIFGPIIVRISMCYLFAFTLNLGLMGIWIGSTLDWGIRGLWLGMVVKKGEWKNVNIA